MSVIDICAVCRDNCKVQKQVDNVYAMEMFDKKGISKEKFANMVINLIESLDDKPLSPHAFELAMSLLYKKYKLGLFEGK